MTAAQVAKLLYTRFGQALQATGRPMVYSMSTNLAALAASTWAPDVGNMWRTTGDITNSYSRMLTNFTSNAALDQAAGPGGWNDPDMLEVGNGGLTPTEDRTQFSLWAEMAAPLIAGNDLTTMTADTRSILTNAKVIAVDQDPLGRQGHVVTSAGGHWVLTKALLNGDRAVVLFNATAQPAVITTTAAQVGLPAAPGYLVDRLWGRTTTETTGTISADVAPHAVSMVRVRAVRGVRITSIYFDPPGPDTGTNTSRNGEWVRIKNFTTGRRVLTGWTLRDAQSHVYRFPTFALAAGAAVKIHTGSGTNTADNLYWGSSTYIWDNTADTATLTNAAGVVLQRCPYTATGYPQAFC